MKKTRILFLCTGNTARSQMAEAFLRRYAGDRFDVYSAGLEPGEIHQLTRQVMAEIGYDLAGHTSKPFERFMGQVHFGYMVTVCSQAEQRCPRVFPGMGQRLYWEFDDPAAFDGTEEEKPAQFRAVRDAIDRRIRDWLAELGVDVAVE